MNAHSGRGKRLLSFIVPVFNEAGNVEPLCVAISAVMQSLSDRYDYELLFTDNHSTDGTFERLERLAQTDQRIRALRFSRNFGYQRSIYTGYVRARGDAAIQIDCDLQDPPELIPEFVNLWEDGHQVVYGIRRSRKESWWMIGMRKAFYRIVNLMSEDRLPLDAGDFRLVDRRILDELRNMEDSQIYLRGAIASMGFNQVGVPYDRGERTWGASKFRLGDLFRLALDGVLNHSVVPLRIATFTGLAVALVTLLLSIGYLAGRLFFRQDWPAGFATTTILILLSLTLNALFLGIIGEYLGRIYRQIKKRPVVIIEKELNSSKSRSDVAEVHGSAQSL